ncbi:hypothetical protein [Rhizohabitans arisaemae]|uniref:hypothetical protein n=1 Tax=Rhizohabitans arisaemae TaxID=2720610 RepID=UPI0024B06219|nr:hypothetical protein [Rhizohabitans arisaemae]
MIANVAYRESLSRLRWRVAAGWRVAWYRGFFEPPVDRPTRWQRLMQAGGPRFADGRNAWARHAERMTRVGFFVVTLPLVVIGEVRRLVAAGPGEQIEQTSS